MHKKYGEPGVLNTPIIMLSLSDVLRQAQDDKPLRRVENCQQMIDQTEKVLDGTAFPASLQGELFEYGIASFFNSCLTTT